MSSDNSIDFVPNERVAIPKNLGDEKNNADVDNKKMSSSEASASGHDHSINVLDTANQPRVNLLKKPVSQSLQCK